MHIKQKDRRSDEYLQLLNELKQSFITAENMVIKLYKQGKKDGLSSNIIRDDIVTALSARGIQRSRLYELLPLELKRHYTVNNNESPLSGQSSDISVEELTDSMDHESLKTLRLEGILQNELEGLSDNYDTIKDSAKKMHYFPHDIKTAERVVGLMMMGSEKISKPIDKELEKEIKNGQQISRPVYDKILEECILVTKSYRLLLRPYVDGTMQRDWLQWCDIVENRYRYTPSYAEKKSGVEVAGTINKKTGKPEIRKMTKENIEDRCPNILSHMFFIISTYMALNAPDDPESLRKAPPYPYEINLETGNIRFIKGYHVPTMEELERDHKGVLKIMRNIVNDIPSVMGLHLNFISCELGHRARRSFTLHDRLSESA